MLVDQQRAADLLRGFDFKTLFVEELGWDRCQAGPAALAVEGDTYLLEAVAEKRGVRVFLCRPEGDGLIPPYRIRQRVDRQVRKLAYEHLLVFVDESKTVQVWQWVDKEPGRSAAYREHTYRTFQPGLSLVQKLESIAFPLSEEEALTISGVTIRLRDAFDRDKVTKRFYERFQSEHEDFLTSIDGMTDDAERAWYSSLMLNRLMFIYFIQKKGFLAEDPDYLRHRLGAVRQERGNGGFLSFYRRFLVRLFHEGLGSEVRTDELDSLLGDVPYLNGGLFDMHELERANSGIDIPDEAFERLFDFFDSYQWHLDERPLAADNEINPDVLGYIFEKYINQKQMGAYYTKEDVTDFIGRNTVVPGLLLRVQEDCPGALAPDSGIWEALRSDPSHYMFAPLSKGCDLELPEDVAGGIVAVNERRRWNEPAPEEYALPTETWREVVFRRQRHQQLLGRMLSGGVVSVGDLLDENVDIRQFCQDLIESCEDANVLWSVWRTLGDLRVLDPACGSGAFLFAALNVLEPLYEGCLERMQGFVEEAAESPGKPGGLPPFGDVLKDVSAHPNSRYYILKSIVINNLYGVDLMEEAVEITKLRLFLKLVAQIDCLEEIEPLPDIDFSVRAGNSLVGFLDYGDAEAAISSKLDFSHSLAEIEESAREVTDLFGLFREMQTKLPLAAKEFQRAKEQLQDRLSRLEDRLDRYLALDAGIDVEVESIYQDWLSTHHPLHWFTEFHDVMQQGGFDVVIGNPPYVSTKKIDYRLEDDGSARYPDIYGYFVERTTRLTRVGGSMGLIVPLSLTFSRDFSELRRHLLGSGPGWFSSFDNIPAAIFSGVSQRCTIWIGRRLPGAHQLLAAPMYRWRSEYRPMLMARIAYSPVLTVDVPRWGIPKVGDAQQAETLARLQQASMAGTAFGRSKAHRIGFSQAARNFISAFIQEPPCLDATTLAALKPSKIGYVNVGSEDLTYASLAALAGEVHFWHWLARGDGFDVTSWIVEDFLACLGTIEPGPMNLLAGLGRAIHARRYEALAFKKNAGVYVGNFNYRGMPFLTRRADGVLACALGLSRSELVNVLDYAQRVLSINVFAGEKSIPAEVKAHFQPDEVDEAAENSLLAEVDELLIEHLGFSKVELRALVEDDVVLGA